jgi:hypothetical protein
MSKIDIQESAGGKAGGHWDAAECYHPNPHENPHHDECLISQSAGSPERDRLIAARLPLSPNALPLSKWQMNLQMILYHVMPGQSILNRKSVHILDNLFRAVYNGSL